MTELERLVGSYTDAAVREFCPPRWSPDCCIAATRLGLLLFQGRLKVRARPLPLVVSGVNAAAREMMRVHGGIPDTETQHRWRDERGAWIVQLGLPETPRAPGRWPGHLALLVNEQWLVDVTCTQASRPGKGIVVPPILQEVSAGFIRGDEEMAQDTTEGAIIGIRSLPGHTGYTRTRDWQDLSRYDLPLERILFRMEQAGALGKKLPNKK